MQSKEELISELATCTSSLLNTIDETCPLRGCPGHTDIPAPLDPFGEAEHAVTEFYAGHKSEFSKFFQAVQEQLVRS